MLRAATLLLAIAFGTSCSDAPAGSESAETPRNVPVSNEPVIAPTPAPVPEVLPQPDAEPPDHAGSSESPEAAAEVVRTYFDHLEAGRYDDAWRMRSSSGASSKSREEFMAHFERYQSYRATVGTPTEPAGAAGSLYVEVPVQTYGRLKNGESFSSAGTITLRRSNNIPGSSPKQRRWHIYTGN